jgi:predicted nucleic acid-binding protein
LNLGRPHFVDSNLFVYAFDAAEPERMVRSREVINYVAQRRLGCISTQVLNETYSNLIKPEKAGMSKEDARVVIENVVANHEVAPVTMPMVEAAIKICIDYPLGYYDSLILAAASAHGATYLLTEDLQAEQVIDGVRVLHVLDDDFDLSRLD